MDTLFHEALHYIILCTLILSRARVQCVIYIHTVVSLIAFKYVHSFVALYSIEHSSRIIGSDLPAYLDLATHLKVW